MGGGCVRPRQDVLRGVHLTYWKINLFHKIKYKHESQNTLHYKHHPCTGMLDLWFLCFLSPWRWHSIVETCWDNTFHKFVLWFVFYFILFHLLYFIIFIVFYCISLYILYFSIFILFYCIVSIAFHCIYCILFYLLTTFIGLFYGLNKHFLIFSVVKNYILVGTVNNHSSFLLT